MASANAIASFLAQPAIAVVGVSRSGHKFGNTACRVLLEKGYRVYPINRKARTIDGMACHSRVGTLPEKVNAVLIVVPPWEALDVVQEAANAGAHHVWLQQGAESPESVALASKLGLELVSGECILMFANPTGVHKVHRMIRTVVKGMTFGVVN
jgi:uncharacterized protein